MSLVGSACDTVREVSASARIATTPLAQECVLESFRTAETVQTVGVRNGVAWARLSIPQSLRRGAPPSEVGVYQRTTADGDLEVRFAVRWVGMTGNSEFTAYVQATIDDLLRRTIERCAADVLPQDPSSKSTTEEIL